MTIALDSDRALENSADDKFGFVGMAKRLAPSIIEASRGDGMVIGLEGRWGSGKTSLLNFLREELSSSENDNIHTIMIEPWLNGDAASLVMSLLGPIAEVLKNREETLAQTSDVNSDEIKAKGAEVFGMLRDYSQKTARQLAPLASLANYVIPGAESVGKALETYAKAMDQFSGKDVTPSVLKRSIAEKIIESDVRFVVILDDLDRLEPAQAVEVVRLVRSVADFPKIAYLMCYDRRVLAQALETGLNVRDGDLFLQKIVQLTFSIPLPEPFDLRTQFRNEAKAIFKGVHGDESDSALLDDLSAAVDREGSGLSTPRDVKLALNGIRFVYSAVSKDVYFPDLCRLHLIKTTNFKLYVWLEEYLSVRSIMVTGDGSINRESKARMGKKLKKLLPSEEINSPRSIWSLSRFIPGLERHDDPDKRVFTDVSGSEAGKMANRKRLGSSFHYRFYFALTGPKAVMPDAEFNELFRLAREDVPSLIDKLRSYASNERSSGRTWFAHVLDRLHDGAVAELDVNTVSGLIRGIVDTMDVVMAHGNTPGPMMLSVSQIAVPIVGNLFKRLADLDTTQHRDLAKILAREGKAINWLVGDFFRDEYWNHGRYGDQPKPEGRWVFSDDLLDELIALIQTRIESPATKDCILNMPDVAGYLYGWRDILGEEGPRSWVAQTSESDSGFLGILNHLRTWAVSDHVYYPLHRTSISTFFNLEAAIARLQSLRGSEHDEHAGELQTAINQARH